MHPVIISPVAVSALASRSGTLDTGRERQLRLVRNRRSDPVNGRDDFEHHCQWVMLSRQWKASVEVK